VRRLAFISTILFLLAGALAGQEKIVITSPGYLHPAAQILRIILAEAYAKIGYAVEFDTSPPLRGIYEMRTGAVDGFLLSDGRFGEEVPESVRVPTSVISDDFVVFSKGEKLPVKNWEDLKPFKILYLAGQFPSETRLKTGYDATAGNAVPEMMLMLDRGRADALVLPKAQGLMIRKQLGLKGIVCSDAVLVSEPLYHFVSAKRASLVPRLDAALAELVKSGRVAAVSERVFSDVERP